MIKKIIKGTIVMFTSNSGKIALQKTRDVIECIFAVYTPIFIIWAFLFVIINKWAFLILLPIFASTYPFHKWLIRKLKEE